MQRRIPLRIILLSLGVLFGFGSAIAHSAHGYAHHEHWRAHCHNDDRQCERDCR